MIRPATRRRACVAVAAAAAAVLTACTAHSAAPPRAQPPTSVPPAHLSHDLPDDAVRMVLPATGAETRWTQGLDVFVQQVERAAAASCARERGAGLPEQVPLAFIRYFELPDLDFIARHGTSASAEVPSPVASPAATGSGSSAVIRRCTAEGRAAAGVLRDAYVDLQGQWFRELTALRGDPETVRATRTVPDCFAGHGIRARDENGFFALADTVMQTAAPAELPRAGRALGSAYAACMRPVEAVREPARLRLRTRFLTDHADDVREMRESLVPSLRRAEKEYGVRLAFPAP